MELAFHLWNLILTMEFLHSLASQNFGQHPNFLMLDKSRTSLDSFIMDGMNDGSSDEFFDGGDDSTSSLYSFTRKLAKSSSPSLYVMTQSNPFELLNTLDGLRIIQVKSCPYLLD